MLEDEESSHSVGSLEEWHDRQQEFVSGVRNSVCFAGAFYQ